MEFWMAIGVSPAGRGGVQFESKFFVQFNKEIFGKVKWVEVL